MSIDVRDAGSTPAPLTKGEQYEKLAFTFCRAATIILLAQKFALIVAAGAATGLYLAAYYKGKKDTRCVLKSPLVAAAFWGVICLIALYGLFRPHALAEPLQVMRREGAAMILHR
jgi:hypothetical protein